MAFTTRSVLCTRKYQLRAYKISLNKSKKLNKDLCMLSTLKNLILFISWKFALVKIPIFINDLCDSYFLLVSGFFSFFI